MFPEAAAGARPSPADSPAFATMRAAAESPTSAAVSWKRRTGGRVIGAFPMNFPLELIHAAGALPVLVQESRTPITEGRGLLPEFYCSYTRSVADQAAVGELDVFDAFVVADHCVQLLGAVDVIRWARPQIPNHFAQFISSMDDPWSRAQVRDKVDAIRAELEEITGAPVEPEALRSSIALYNRNRALLREFFAARRTGRIHLPASDLQVLVKSAMVMDVQEHTELLERFRAELAERPRPAAPVPVHLSGHFCAPVRLELLDAIEDAGVVAVDDDLYHGQRYIATDVPETGDPFDALADWYLDRNVSAPCATRVQRDVDWDAYLVDHLWTSGAVGVVVLMAKFCEPLMLYFPELRKALEARGVPVLLIETEHEGVPEESIRTRVEAFAERLRRGQPVGGVRR
jgi:benzoyl-CoA reductase subunit C